ncbi:hypothetical protein [Maritimibacter alexandrii]|uniref:hypothetical protein n=1 Tax=Maritimibacter alexandrii TaxID=2570355 RepID=UPI001109E019|nr:hypothetical protein [Maritimibacter alexandrii]
MKRQIIEEEAARKAINDAEGKWPRAEMAWEAATLVIAYDPEEGKPLTESGKVRAFTYQGSRSIGMPSLTVVYEDQDPFLFVHDVKFWDAGKYEQQFH